MKEKPQEDPPRRCSPATAPRQHPRCGRAGLARGLAAPRALFARGPHFPPGSVPPSPHSDAGGAPGRGAETRGGAGFPSTPLRAPLSPGGAGKAGGSVAAAGLGSCGVTSVPRAGARGGGHERRLLALQRDLPGLGAALGLGTRGPGRVAGAAPSAHPRGPGDTGARAPAPHSGSWNPRPGPEPHHARPRPT